jgi:hypothetical protein
MVAQVTLGLGRTESVVESVLEFADLTAWRNGSGPGQRKLQASVIHLPPFRCHHDARASAVKIEHFKLDADRLRRAFPRTAQPVELDEDYVGVSNPSWLRLTTARSSLKRHTFLLCLGLGAIGGVIGGAFGGFLLSSHQPALWILVSVICGIIGMVPGLLFGLLAIAVRSGVSDGAGTGAVDATLAAVAFGTSAVLTGFITLYLVLQAMASC